MAIKSIKWLILVWILLLLTSCRPNFAVCPCTVKRVEYIGKYDYTNNKNIYSVTAVDSEEYGLNFFTAKRYNVGDTINF